MELKRSASEKAKTAPNKKVKFSDDFEESPKGKKEFTSKNKAGGKQNNHNGKPKFEKGYNKQPPGGKKFNSKDGKSNKFENGKRKPFEQNKFTEEKPENWNVYKKEKKELLLKRKQSKGSYDVILGAKRLSEKIRHKNLKGGDEERRKLISEMHDMLKTDKNYVKFALAHDMSRVIQTMLRLGSEDVKAAISKEIIPSTVNIMKSKYGVHVINALLKHGSASSRQECIKAMYGSAIKLTTHTITAPLFEQMINKWATKQDKHNFIQEFFGSMYRHTKDANIKELKDAFTASPDMKTSIIRATKGSIFKMLNKSNVNLDSTLFHSVIHQYFNECRNNVDKAYTDMIALLVPHSVVLSNTKDGSRVVMECIWKGTNKDRKAILKAMKEHGVEMAKHEHGHTTIIALIDAFDDTVLLKKILIDPLLEKADELLANANGRKVLTWMVAPADKSHFHPTFIDEIESGRKGSNSKKDPELRQKEIRQFTSDYLLDKITLAPRVWFENPAKASTVLSIFKSGSGNQLTLALKSVCEVLCDPEWKLGAKKELAVENPGIHMILKKLAQNDKEKLEKEQSTFGECLLKELETNEDIIKSWLKLNRCCYVFNEILVNNRDSVRDQYKKILNQQKAILEKSSTSGAKLLLEKLNN